MSKKEPVIAHLKIKGEVFEILVDPDLAFEYKRGNKNISIYNILAIDEIFEDAKKGKRAPEGKLTKFFNTEDIYEIAKIILEQGELQITTEQRRQLIEQNKKKIAYIISRCAVDPRTKLPHPVDRILNAMEKARVKIDPFKSAEEQVEEIIEEIRKKNILPLIVASRKIEIIVPAELAPKVFGQLKKISGLKSEDWLSDGSLKCIFEIPAGAVDEIIGKINKIGQGKINFKFID